MKFMKEDCEIDQKHHQNCKWAKWRDGVIYKQRIHRVSQGMILLSWSQVHVVWPSRRLINPAAQLVIQLYDRFTEKSVSFKEGINHIQCLV